MWIMAKFNFISRRYSCHHRHVDHLRYMYIGRFSRFWLIDPISYSESINTPNLV